MKIVIQLKGSNAKIWDIMVLTSIPCTTFVIKSYLSYCSCAAALHSLSINFWPFSSARSKGHIHSQNCLGVSSFCTILCKLEIPRDQQFQPHQSHKSLWSHSRPFIHTPDSNINWSSWFWSMMPHDISEWINFLFFLEGFKICCGVTWVSVTHLVQGHGGSGAYPRNTRHKTGPYPE